MKTTQKNAVLNFIELLNENSIKSIQYDIVNKHTDRMEDRTEDWSAEIYQVDMSDRYVEYSDTLSEPQKILNFLDSIGISHVIAVSDSPTIELNRNPFIHIF